MMHIIFLTQDQAFINATKQIIDKSYIASFIIIEQECVEQTLNNILGIENGQLGAEIVVIDSDCLSAKTIQLFMNSLIGAGISVFVRVTTSDIECLWMVSSLGAHLFHLDQMNVDFEEVLKNRKYNPLTLEVENKFAEVYDREELSSAATLSAILWENDYTLTQIKNYIKNKKESVRILDMGCGTGRIEEILLSDPELVDKIESIHAIDFAPMFLKKARERLSHFLSDSALKRIIFMRRIVEDTRLPANYFDIVIASFGVVCFSQFHRTVPEIYRLLKPSGLVVLNGYNRNAVAHDFNLAMQEGVKSLFTAHIDRERNEMHLSDKVIKCFSFDVDELHAFLKLIGLMPQVDSTQTFPTLYSCARKEYLQLLEPNLSISKEEPISYQSSNLEKDFFSSGFSPIVHKMDMDLTKSLKNRGFYFAMTATK